MRWTPRIIGGLLGNGKLHAGNWKPCSREVSRFAFLALPMLLRESTAYIINRRAVPWALSLPAYQWQPQLNGPRVIHARPKQANQEPFRRNFKLRHKDSYSLMQSLVYVRIMRDSLVLPLVFRTKAEGYLISRMCLMQQIWNIGHF